VRSIFRGTPVRGVEAVWLTFGLALCGLFVPATEVARGQGPSGGGAYFGAANNAAFTPQEAFAPPKIPVPPSVLPAQAIVPSDPPIGAGADGGLLPPLPPPAPPLWSGSAEAGVNGASGNAELFNLRIAFDANRKTDNNLLNTNFLYTYTEQDSLLSVHQALLNVRDEILFANSPWSLFGAMNLEYDELRAYRFRVGIYAGVGYTVLNTDTTLLKLRAGAGAVREIGTGDLADRWVPEMVFGYDWNYKINDRGSLMSTLDYYPRIDDFSQFRLRVRAGYEYVLDPETGTVFRLGIQNRYDSDPGNAQRNDLTYFATLGIKF